MRPGDDGRVIPFPTWRRAMEGAPGIDETDGADRLDGSDGLPPEVHGLDRPVWHEGSSATGEVIVRLRADILRLTPPVWRRLECLGSLTLDRMHPVLAAAFGWDREHEYRFRDVVRERGTRLGATFGNAWTPPSTIRESQVRLDQALPAPRERLRYTYGRRTGFEVTIVAEDVMPLPPSSSGETPPARVLAGRRNDPPAAFHGAGLYDLVVHGHRADQIAGLDLELPPGFDPAAFDLDLADRRVRAAVER